jgi:hypothetical protein
LHWQSNGNGSVYTTISPEIERIFSPIIVTAIGDLSSKSIGAILDGDELLPLPV